MTDEMTDEMDLPGLTYKMTDEMDLTRLTDEMTDEMDLTRLTDKMTDEMATLKFFTTKEENPSSSPLAPSRFCHYSTKTGAEAGAGPIRMNPQISSPSLLMIKISLHPQHHH